MSPEVQRRQPAAASAPGWQGQRRGRREWAPGLRSVRGVSPLGPACGPSPGTRARRRSATAFNFPGPLPLAGPSQGPAHVNGPRSQWTRLQRELSTSGRGAVSRSAPLRHVIGRAPAGTRLASRGWEGGSLIRNPGKGARGQSHPPTEERLVTARSWTAALCRRLAKFLLPKPGPSLPSSTDAFAVAVAFTPTRQLRLISHLSHWIHRCP